MKRTTCPYLGLSDDPTTAMNFPSEGNFCHHARPVAAVSKAHQQHNCLTADHRLCPVFRSARPIPLPDKLADSDFLEGRKKRQLMLVSIPFIVGVVILFILAGSMVATRLSFAGMVIPQTGDHAQASIPENLGFQPVHPSNTPTIVPQYNELPAGPQSCLRPDGWVSYIVNPTDSLFRLSMVYGVSVDTLQATNCMGANTLILPGQVIFVPIIPTSTPSSSPTAAPLPTSTWTAAPRPRIVAPTSTPSPHNNPPPPPANTAVAPTNTAVTPTDTIIQPPNTPVPPTNTAPPPPSQTPKQQDPPSEKPKPTKKPKDDDSSAGIIITTATLIIPVIDPPKHSDNEEDNSGNDDEDSEQDDAGNKGKGKGKGKDKDK